MNYPAPDFHGEFDITSPFLKVSGVKLPVSISNGIISIRNDQNQDIFKISSDSDLTDNSDLIIPTQKAVKSYYSRVDGVVAPLLLSSNLPQLTLEDTVSNIQSVVYTTNTGEFHILNPAKILLKSGSIDLTSTISQILTIGKEGELRISFSVDLDNNLAIRSNGTTYFMDETVSTNPVTGSVVIAGGLGVAEKINAGSITAASCEFDTGSFDSLDLNTAAIETLTCDTGIFNGNGPTQLSISNNGAGESRFSLVGMNNELQLSTDSGTFKLTDVTPSISKTSGSLQLAGGLGIEGNIYGAGANFESLECGVTHFTDDLDSNSTITGSVVLDGGLGVAKSIFTNSLHCQTFESIDATVGTSNVIDDTNATSKTTGSLQVAGGIGCSKDIYCSNLYADNIVSSETVYTCFSILGVSRPTQGHEPTYDQLPQSSLCAYRFQDNDVGSLSATFRIPNDWKVGTNLYSEINWSTADTTEGFCRWRWIYNVTNPGGQWGLDIAAEGGFEPCDTINQTTRFLTLNGANIQEGAMIAMNLEYLNTSTYPGLVYLFDWVLYYQRK